MRLIDADALIEFCAERWIPLNIDVVNMQPTIQSECDWTTFGERLSKPLKIAVIISKPLNYLDLSTRSYNALRRWGINTIADLIEAKENGELPKIRNLGSKSIIEIDHLLDMYITSRL